MSLPVVLETAPPVRRRARALALLTVTVARGLAMLPPGRLRRVLVVACRGARPATADQALSARNAVVSVSRRCAAQQCLQRSLATALLCRLHGTWPEWRTGVRTEPFRAHAWVAVDGQPIGESDDIRLFRTVMAVRVDGRC